MAPAFGIERPGQHLAQNGRILAQRLVSTCAVASCFLTRLESHADAPYQGRWTWPTSAFGAVAGAAASGPI